MDIELAIELMNSAAEAADILGVDAHKAALWRNIASKLPKAWPKGSVRNFRAQDGVTVSFAWEKGQLVSCELTSTEDQTLCVISGNRKWNVALKADLRHANIYQCGI